MLSDEWPSAWGLDLGLSDKTLRIARWAHRGAGKTAPENTLAAIREGARRGFTAVEFDTMPTLDGHWILHHDWVTGRTLKPRDALAEGRRIVEMTLGELQGYEAGSWLDSAFAGEKVPLLSEALQVCAELGMQVNVELKLDVDSGLFNSPVVLQSTAASLLSQLQASPYAMGADSRVVDAGEAGEARAAQDVVFSDRSDQLIVSSFGLEGLYALRQAGYTGRLAPLFEVMSDDWVRHARDLQAEAVHTHHSQASAEWVRRVHTTGRAFRVYTVNDPQRLADIDAMGVDDCFTDNMDFSPGQ